ncbi:hypothetical protein [Amycolatopsis keratiniphila]|uniref:hypothetical protein n=1 Tax=Amycolatopsis keratiniphila TaxID=129921 RepID=UPI000ADD1405|nr:hypothetical protein [Amycolatopsis keratiniphila]
MKTGRSRFVHSAGYVLEYDLAVPEEPVSSYLHVLFHGASRIEAHTPPVFARRQWTRSAQEACLFVCDPIHMHTKGSNCGWFLLGENEFLPKLLELRESVMAEYGFTGCVWHGLSSGGYAALKYWMRSGADDLAFVIAPHDDPKQLWQWERYAVPFLDLPAWGEPVPTTRQMDDWLTPGVARYLHAVVSEKEAYYALEHLRPILERAGYSDGVRAVKLRNGRDHGFIADADYETQLASAIRDWEAYRAKAAIAPRPSQPDRTGGRA